MNESEQDWFGEAIGLQFAIAELHSELTVDGIQENPRLVMLAIGGLDAKAALLIAAMKKSMGKGEVDSGKD
jgi:hypothetical protein